MSVDTPRALLFFHDGRRRIVVPARVSPARGTQYASIVINHGTYEFDQRYESDREPAAGATARPARLRRPPGPASGRLDLADDRQLGRAQP